MDIALQAEIIANSDRDDMFLLVGLNDQPKARFLLSTELQHLNISINDDTQDKENYLEFWLVGKKPEHTVLDHHGNIIKDITVDIKNIRLDDINIDQIFYKNSTYVVDHSEGQEQPLDHFYGTMGRSGVVRLKFTTPIFIWLLENM